jgi:proline dehydrogenase
MSLARSALLAAARSEFLNRQATRRSFVRRAVRKFMPGEKPEDALRAADNLAREGRGALFTRLGEALTRLEEAQEVRDHYLWLFDQIQERGLPAQVSVKPTQLGLNQSYDVCAEHIDALGAKAMATGSTLWLDMEDSTLVDQTLDLYTTLKSRHERSGIAIQAYLYRTPDDIERLMPLKPIIRLVKGAYAEPAEVAFPRKADTDDAFYRISDGLLTAASTGDCLPIFGTHDTHLLARIINRANDLAVPDGSYEIHMLYGILDAEQRRLRSEGHRVKTLISYGDAWFKWYMRRLAERPANVWFVVRTMFG